MDNKVIIVGNLDFGAARNYEQVVKLFEHRRDNYYRGDIFVNSEESFNEENLSLEIPRAAINCSDRAWLNTLNLLKQIVNYAVVGDIAVWRIKENEVIDHLVLEPRNDRSATQAFLRGRELLSETGHEQEAREALSEAIEKFERHAAAYERRGYVNFRLKNYDDAIYDYTRSISINDTKPEPYFGRGYIYFMRGEWEKAAADFAQVFRYAIPHQGIYWKARVYKGDALMQLGKTAEAAKEYKLFLQRRRYDEDPLRTWDRRIALSYGKVQAAAGQYKDAVETFNRALQSPMDENSPNEAEILLHRGLAAKQLGQKSFLEDWKRAATEGNEEAAQLLQEVG